MQVIKKTKTVNVLRIIVEIKYLQLFVVCQYSKFLYFHDFAAS